MLGWIHVGDDALLSSIGLAVIAIIASGSAISRFRHQ